MRITLSVIVLVLLLWSTDKTTAQDSLRAEYAISVHAGVMSLAHKDLYRSPYTYSGWNSSFALQLDRTGRKSIHRVSAEFVTGSSKTSFSPLASQNRSRLQYTYLQKIGSWKKASLFAGPQLNGLSWNVNYFPEMKVPSYSGVRSYLVSLSLGLAVDLRYSFNSRNHLYASFSIPIGSYLNRPAFLDGNPNKGEWGIFNYWNPQVRLTFQHDFSKKISLLVNCQYDYFEYAKPKPIRMLSNGFWLGLKIKL